MKNNQKGFVNIVLIGVIVIIVVVGGYFALVKKPISPINTSMQNQVQVLSFLIQPSVKDGGWTIYGTGAKTVLIAGNLKSAEVQYYPTGTEVTESISAGKMSKVTESLSGDTWELRLPEYIMATNLWVEIEDMSGHKSKSIELGKVGYKDSTQSNTSNWKTYTNEQYRFEFKYLKDWTIMDVGLGQIFYAPSLKDSLDEIGYCNNVSECNQEYFTLSTVLDEQSSPPVENKIFNGVEFIVYRVYYDTTEQLKTIYEYEVPGYGIRLTFMAYQEGLTYLDQVLSTFKFTDSVSVDKFTVVTIDALSRNPSGFLNTKVQITGKLILVGKNYFTDPSFALTDGINEFKVSGWLPLEFPPSPSGSSQPVQAKTMKTYLDKNITLQGIVEQNSQGFFLRVMEVL